MPFLITAPYFKMANEYIFFDFLSCSHWTLRGVLGTAIDVETSVRKSGTHPGHFTHLLVDVGWAYRRGRGQGVKAILSSKFRKFSSKLKIDGLKNFTHKSLAGLNYAQKLIYPSDLHEIEV